MVQTARQPTPPMTVPGSSAGVVNVAATWIGTRALGPGWRSVVWVQGCPFRCPGCMAPEWIVQRPVRLVEPADLAAELLADPAVTGLTFSGGEPMLQAASLAETARAARRIRELTLICFTGFRLERLRDQEPASGVADLLAQVDVLVDGLYVAALNDGRGLRGSTNQGIHHLSGRLERCGYDFAGGPRRAEIRMAGNYANVVGVPPPGLLSALDIAVNRARERALTPPRPSPAPQGGSE
jgi:anaerobic ribonucleoside-triphosphate reductase activating protein